VITNVAKPEGSHAPMGQLIKLREYPNASFGDVTAPNADTLYTTAFMDLVSEPWVLSIPNMKSRYYLFPMLDGWTTAFQVPGKRTTGTGAQTYAITGPGWKGTLPAGVQEYKSPTSIVWLLGRIANPDGSTDIYIQKDSPGSEQESSWLPAPSDKFILMLRMYWPNETRPSIMNGSWTVPPVNKLA